MKKQKKQGLMKRLFVWIVEPFFIIGSAWKTIVPQKATEEELRVFNELTPDQRWKNAQEKQGWTIEQLASERKRSCWLAYLFLFCSWMIVVGTLLAAKYMSSFQIIGAFAYSATAFFFFAKKSIAVYAIDRKQIISLKDWLLMPSVWIPFTH